MPVEKRGESLSEQDRFGHSVTHRIWSDLDHVLLIYVGAAAEFALVEENHWLFYTNKLPVDPLGRLMSTFVWHRKLLEVPAADMPALAARIRGFHDPVEKQRSREEGRNLEISNSAFLSVGFMLIAYGLQSSAYLKRRPLTAEEAEEYYMDQRDVLKAMGIQEVPETFEAYRLQRQDMLTSTLQPNAYTEALFMAYRRSLGFWRYSLLVAFMAGFVPETVRDALSLRRIRWLGWFITWYPRIRCRPLSRLLQWMLVPRRIRRQLMQPVSG